MPVFFFTKKLCSIIDNVCIYYAYLMNCIPLKRIYITGSVNSTVVLSSFFDWDLEMRPLWKGAYDTGLEMTGRLDAH